MPDAPPLLTSQQAFQILDSIPLNPRIESMPLESAQGRRLAADLTADRDYPPFDKSQMDGIAIRHEDLSSNLHLIGEIPAGSWPTRPLSPGQAIRIMTGAPLPPGADTVIPVEHITATADHCQVLKPFKKHNAISPQGAEVRAGQIVLHAGTILNPPQLAVAATIGAAQVPVYAPPRIAILTTGDEVVHYSQSPAPAQIRNSNSLLLSSMLWNLNCDITDLGIAPDHPDTLRDYLTEGLSYDVLFITGGMSMGNYDYVPTLLQQLGVTLQISKVKIKPGKPFLFGKFSGFSFPGSAKIKAPSSPSSLNPEPLNPDHSCLVFGLPGNPVSAFVCTTLFATRIISRLTGGSPHPRTSTHTLTTPLPPNGPREFFQPVLLQNNSATPLPWKGSSDLFTLAQANALLSRPENAPPLPAGSSVEVIEI
ncbi:MAG TPA: gephyrin-like molybdotransferase Glp [Tepidisphaeraceae bacterium]|nr:gephyrin-like molybdotransferase Glp [Tepidisphaeraceae bacterium]